VRHVPLKAPTEQEGVLPEEAFADRLNVEVELERKELIALLDRAMSALPPETRTALVKHYVEESPLAEIAAHLWRGTKCHSLGRKEATV
jgi:DNA-directed RNA polymerase specialized sigma24 family protein